VCSPPSTHGPDQSQCSFRLVWTPWPPPSGATCLLFQLVISQPTHGRLRETECLVSPRLVVPGLRSSSRDHGRLHKVRKALSVPVNHQVCPLPAVSSTHKQECHSVTYVRPHRLRGGSLQRSGRSWVTRSVTHTTIAPIAGGSAQAIPASTPRISFPAILPTVLRTGIPLPARTLAMGDPTERIAPQILLRI